MTVRDVRELAHGPSRRAAVDRAQTAYRGRDAQRALAAEHELKRVRSQRDTYRSTTELLGRELRAADDRIDELEAELDALRSA